MTFRIEKSLRKNGKWAKISGKRGKWFLAHGWSGKPGGYLKHFRTRAEALTAGRHWLNEPSQCST